MITEFVKPRVVISKCIEFEHCRWNGLIIRSDAVKIFKPFFDFVPVCPEMEIGLGCPRDPIRLVHKEGDSRLIQPSTERDLTDSMRRFADDFLASVGEIEGFLLQNRSPSCGTGDVKIYAAPDTSRGVGKGPGTFAALAQERCGHLPIEDEGRLRNFGIREHFLTKVFLRARFRTVRETGTAGALVDFHTRNKMILSACSQKEMRLMGKIVANHEKRPPAEVIADYEEHLDLAIARPARIPSNINVLMHALGYFKEKLSGSEKAFFLKSLEQYRLKKVPLSVCTSLVKAWIVRFDEAYLEAQSFFEPYPDDLVEISDSGVGRKLQ